MKKLFRFFYKTTITFFTFLLILTFFLGNIGGQAKAAQQPHRTFIIVVDRVLPQHLIEYGGESLQKILTNSAWAILSNATARGKSSENQAMTIGAGSRALAPYGNYFFNKGEVYEGIYAERIYHTFNNFRLREEMTFNPYINNIQYINSNLSHTVEVGKMADLLKEQGIKRVVIGNSDDFDIKRHASAILMDSNGVVDYGIIDERILKKNDKIPGGSSTDYDKVIEYLQYYLPKGNIFVIDTGDTHRIDEYYRFYQPERLEQLREEIIKEMDILFTYLLNVMEERDHLYLLTLNAPLSYREEGENIPVIYHYQKGGKEGILTAPSTKRPGVITTLDLAPSILNNYGIKDPTFYGSVMDIIEMKEHQSFIFARLKQINTVFNQRPITIRIYIVITIVIVVAFLINLKLQSIPMEYFSSLILTAMAGPLIFLLMPIFGPLPLVPYLITFYLLCAITAFMIRRYIKNPISGIITLSGITLSAILVDTMFNSFLQKQSILGYDVIAGARFYGIGNEYMGVIIGSSIIATFPLLQRPERKKWLYLIYGTIAIIMMAPFWGTNFGGTLSLAVTFAVALIDIKEGKGSVKYLLALGIVFVLALTAMITINVISQDQTHIGRIFSGENANRLEEILLAITRKLSTNWRLIRFSIWSRIFAVLLVSTIIIGFYPPKKFSFVKEKHYYRGIKAILAGSLAALFLNDSGIVAAATAMIFLALPILYVFSLDNSPSNSPHLS
ncbi:hypothetical protein [Anaerobranca gottschalkii]|uniref:Uncharacterized protein n=1 Tax=Anaerobranca gottschalkii DSM 13577 TaxID=1120990 RepID=A0A1I0ALC5_9FIRM|nr:hypothetical protein [Anaerobranca gottschalkii]SES94531.1 hypothetical protein SAMN03080614_10234 [Anaerobranca gottschalkii DSM 13577]